MGDVRREGRTAIWDQYCQYGGPGVELRSGRQRVTALSPSAGLTYVALSGRPRTTIRSTSLSALLCSNRVPALFDGSELEQRWRKLMEVGVRVGADQKYFGTTPTWRYTSRRCRPLDKDLFSENAVLPYRPDHGHDQRTDHVRSQVLCR